MRFPSPPRSGRHRLGPLAAALVCAIAPSAPVFAEEPPPSRLAAGASVFNAAIPDFANGIEMTRFVVYEDFEIAARTTVVGMRFWTLEAVGAWDGTFLYSIHEDDGGEPGDALYADSAPLTRALTDRQGSFGSLEVAEIQNDAAFTFPQTLDPGRYWVAIRMAAGCSTARGVYWESGFPGFGERGFNDEGCDGSGLQNNGSELAMQILGNVGGVSLDLSPADPEIANVLFRSTIGDADRGVAFEALTNVPIRSVGIMAVVGEATDLTATIRTVTGTALGAVAAQSTVRVSPGGPGFFSVPIDFTFRAGRRYDVAFNIPGGWGNPSDHALELFAFDNSDFSANFAFDVGPLRVLDGRGQPPIGQSDPYRNDLFPHLRIGLAEQPFDAYGLMSSAGAPGAHLVGFNLDRPENLTLVAPLPRYRVVDGRVVASMWSGLDFRPGAGLDRVYAIDAAHDRLATFDTRTGEYAEIGAAAPNGAELFSALAFDPASGNLYATGTDDLVSSLYRLNPDTAAATRIGRVTGTGLGSTPPSLAGLTADLSGRLFGLDLGGDNLLSIEPATATGTRIGSVGVDLQFSQGIDFDPFTGLIFGALFRSTENPAELRTIDPATGASALVGTLGTAYPGGNPLLSSIAIALDVVPSPTPTATPGPTATPTPSPTPTPGSSRLVNISTRGFVGEGDQVMIAGFIVEGTEPVEAIVTGIGPDLENFGVVDPLTDPELALFRGSTPILTNGDWTQAPNFQAIAASGYAPNVARESAILTTLEPGAYTAKLSGTGGGVGNGLIQVFELGAPSASRLVNISTRGRVRTGSGVMIAGVTISGSEDGTVLVRGLGPTLAGFGVEGALANPILTLFDGGTLIAVNDDWRVQGGAGAVEATGLAPPNDAEPAILATLAPGQYTAILEGVASTEGVGLVEVYRVE